MFKINGTFTTGDAWEDTAEDFAELIGTLDGINGNSAISEYEVEEDGIQKELSDVLYDHARDAEEIIRGSEDPDDTENHIVGLFGCNPWEIRKEPEMTENRVEAEEIAKRIREAGEWNPADCEELCRLAGMTAEWNASDGETFEHVLNDAAAKLGVEII